MFFITFDPKSYSLHDVKREQKAQRPEIISKVVCDNDVVAKL